jgi:hypothetical protein
VLEVALELARARELVRVRQQRRQRGVPAEALRHARLLDGA